MQHRSPEPTTSRAESPERAHPHGGLRETIGDVIGQIWAPVISEIARLRGARTFHPVGHTFSGRIEPIIGGHFDALGARLDGRVLVRVSGALSKSEREWFDVLGIGLRIRPGRGPAITETAEPGDQDLLFATIRSPFTMALAPFATDASNFLQSYWAVSPFSAPPVGKLELRLQPIGRGAIGGSRLNKLREAVRRNDAGWRLEARRTMTLDWHPVAVISLERETNLDQAALAFDPFRAGADIAPVGFVHAIRRAAYAASRRGRPQAEIK
jgi:hypothetical protein